MTHSVIADKSFWLAAGNARTMIPVKEERIQHFISHCSVCETSFNVLAVHSLSTQVPNCPLGWSSLWTGYSFVGREGVLGQELGLV